MLQITCIFLLKQVLQYLVFLFKQFLTQFLVSGGCIGALFEGKEDSSCHDYTKKPENLSVHQKHPYPEGIKNCVGAPCV